MPRESVMDFGDSHPRNDVAEMVIIHNNGIPLQRSRRNNTLLAQPGICHTFHSGLCLCGTDPALICLGDLKRPQRRHFEITTWCLKIYKRALQWFIVLFPALQKTVDHQLEIIIAISVKTIFQKAALFSQTGFCILDTI